jgi:hypothetical protein
VYQYCTIWYDDWARKYTWQNGVRYWYLGVHGGLDDVILYDAHIQLIEIRYLTVVFDTLSKRPRERSGTWRKYNHLRLLNHSSISCWNNSVLVASPSQFYFEMISNCISWKRKPPVAPSIVSAELGPHTYISAQQPHSQSASSYFSRIARSAF